MLLTSRGSIGGFIALSAAAPFVPTWAALLIGGIAGLWVPISMFVIDRLLKLDDSSGSIASVGLAGLWSLIAIGLLANGNYGVGWNDIGLKEYLGTASQGVTGLFADGSLRNDPGQMSAQITGILAISFVALIVPWLFTRPFRKANQQVHESAHEIIGFQQPAIEDEE